MVSLLYLFHCVSLQSTSKECKKIGPAILPPISGTNPHISACTESGQRNAGVYAVWVSYMIMRLHL